MARCSEMFRVHVLVNNQPAGCDWSFHIVLRLGWEELEMSGRWEKIKA